jgi:hypothetical protein
MIDKIEIDLTDLVKFEKKHLGTDWPKAVTSAFSEIAEGARDGIRALTREKFKLHTDYVPRGINHYPDTTTQKTRAAHALEKYGDMNAAVYLRGGNDPKKSLEFMADHEHGETRTPVGKWIAVPGKDLKEKSYRTTRGTVRKIFQPSELLKRFNEAGSTFDGKTTVTRQYAAGRKRGKIKAPGNAFIIMGKKGSPMIVRRKHRGQGRNLEMLFVLKTRAEIKKAWGFVNGVYAVVRNVYGSVMVKHIGRLPNG